MAIKCNNLDTIVQVNTPDISIDQYQVFWINE